MKNNFNAKKGISQRVMDLIKPLLSTSETYSGESPLIKKDVTHRAITEI